MNTMFYIIAGMMVILAVLLVMENRKSSNFGGFCAVSMWFIILAIMAGYIGYII